MVAEVRHESGVDDDDRALDAVERRDQLSAARSFFTLSPSSLTARIILLNIAGLIILVSGILYFNQFRQGLIDARVQSLMTQGHIIAGAIAASATVDTDSIVVDPDRLLDLQTGNRSGPDADESRSFEFPINPERAGQILRRLISPTKTRARIYDREGILVVDSHYLYGRGEILRFELPPPDSSPQSVVIDLWHGFNNWLFSNEYPLQKEYGNDNGKDFPEVTASLNGAAVSVVRVNEKHEIIVSVAVPIQRFRAVLGALVLSTQGGDIDDTLRGERRIILFTFMFAALVTVLLSVLLAGTIAEPIRRLALAAERVRHGVNKRVEIPDFSSRRDEIGHLSIALRDMTNALYSRIAAIENFAADVSHELKNPLTSLRSAVETLDYIKNDGQRQRLLAIIKDDLKRLDRLITDISDASRLDAELARSESRTIDIVELLNMVISIANETRNGDQAEIVLRIIPPPDNVEDAFLVTGHDIRLGQVIRNLLDNARSFSPADSTIRVRLRRVSGEVEICVDDDGTGIRPESMDKIFDRFHTDRPEGSFGQNSGLGLSISKQIVEAHRGRIWAENRYGPPSGEFGEKPVLGARFLVRLRPIDNDE
ncbi:two-component system sensor histidine kinase ChvG [Rhodoligotrophos appendicifer]|uniref:sensor histidine kinase n=1 Tax=Rhodoligotrophos appendicifer TaxID=987056 RepID=UPI00117FB795|nr:sensor histidine kinase [Rhodoligotrophos appendicifer]